MDCNHNPINGIRHGVLTSAAFRGLMDILKGYGNEPSEAQRKALYEILSCYSSMAQGALAGRYAFPLSTGLGKTQSIVAWLAALNLLVHSHISVAICTSKVEALCDLKRDLIEREVPEDKIGLFHSYSYDKSKIGLPGYASLPSTDDHKHPWKQILLVTHNRVRGKCGPDKYNTFQGQPRNLLIWDESLLVSDTRAIRHREVKGGLGWLKAVIEGPDRRRGVCDYLTVCDELLTGELERVRKGGKAEAIRLPELPPAKLLDFKACLGKHQAVLPLKSLLDMSQTNLRMAVTDQGGGVITYDIVVPQELENVVILDASHTIRELVKLDKSIKQTNLGRFSENILSYQNVIVHQLKHPSGRSTMTEAFSPSKREARKVSLEIAEVVKAIPGDEGILIFTFKKHDRAVDFERVLRKDFKAEGIDTSTKVSVNGKPEDRFVWLTWGQETSLSKFSYCSNVIFAGVLHRDHIEIASAIAGQKNDLLTPIPADLVRDVVRSEIGHCLYQAMSRGSCRIVKRGVTLPMKVWLIHRDLSIKDLLEKVMPGVNWKVWVSKHINQNSGKIDSLAQKVISYLESLPLTEGKVSTCKIKKELSLKDTPGSTFTCAVESVCVQTAWFMEGRSLSRLFEPV